MDNLDKMKKGLEAYIYLNEYTLSSFAKKHSLSLKTLKGLQYRALVDIPQSVQREILDDIMQKEGVTPERLESYIEMADELETMMKMTETKGKSLLRNRDPKRIKPFLEEFENLWSMYPDLRFGQLVSIISSRIDGDSFYIEDDVWLDKIREKISE